MLKLEKYSLGVGDRFALQARAQLRACMIAAEQGVTVIPVWNKSHREHTTIGSQPESVREAADAAVQALGWTHPYHVDADHIRLDTVDRYLSSSDFFTIDVADCIGRPAPDALIEAFRKRHPELAGRIMIPYLDTPYEVSPAELQRIAGKYLLAVQEAGRIYRRIAEAKGADNIIAEVSMDETDSPQTPVELLVILAAIADEGIPIQTIAPKFTGRFNKGVDYVGDVRQFEREFQADLAVLAIAARQYGLPENLKLSVHSGSDKFSISESIRRSLVKFDAGVHVKTAGTTWLEEIIGLAEAGSIGLTLAKGIYELAFEKREALCAPYSAVIDIDPDKLPPPSDVAEWSSERFASAVRHDQSNPEFNPSMRQLLHVGYKIAAQMGARFPGIVEACKSTIAPNVTANLYERHIKPLFLDPVK